MPKKVGRPTKMTDVALGKLDQAFAMGCTDTEACCYADISVDVLYDYQKANPEYAKRKAVLKDTPFLKARARLMQDIDSSQEWIANSTSRYLIDKKDGKATQRVAVDADIVVKVQSFDDDAPGTGAGQQVQQDTAGDDDY